MTRSATIHVAMRRPTPARRISKDMSVTRHDPASGASSRRGAPKVKVAERDRGSGPLSVAAVVLAPAPFRQTWPE